VLICKPMRLRRYLNLFGLPRVIEILRVFSRNNTHYTGRQIAKEIGVNHVSVTKSLSTLVEYEILNMSVVAKSYLYTINNSYYTTELLLPLLYKESKLFETIKERILNEVGELCSHISIFGSYANGEEHDGSDLDVFFVGKNKNEFNKKWDLLASEIRNTYLLQVSPYFVLEQELEEKKKLKLLENIKKESIWLKGSKRDL
jgi:predicted nucleotidyltransferase